MDYFSFWIQTMSALSSCEKEVGRIRGLLISSTTLPTLALILYSFTFNARTRQHLTEEAVSAEKNESG